MSKGPKGPRNPMGWGNDDPRRVKGTGRTMHGSKHEQRLMSGLGRLIRQDGSRVTVSGDKPGSRQRRKP
jgi:hypothetical protein